MATQNFSVPEGTCAAAVKTTSPSAVMNSNPQSVQIRLVSSEWDAKAGTGSVRWGTERSPDGTTWEEWMSQPIAIGQRGGKDGLLPAIRVSGGDIVNMVGWRVRLFAVPDVAIKLGADITVIS